jgi:hypothetical protein
VKPSRPATPLWRRLMLVAMAPFYGFFVVRSVAQLIGT